MKELFTNLLLKLRSFIEIVWTLLLGFLLVVVVWWFSTTAYEVMHIEKHKKENPMFSYWVDFADICSYLSTVLYIVGDLIVETYKVYKQLRNM